MWGLFVVTTNLQRAAANLTDNDTRAYTGVTELILADQSTAQLELVLPMIIHLSQQQSERWVTWITQRNLDRKALLARGINQKVFRTLSCTDANNLLWLTWEALSLGTSHTVIADAGRLSEIQIKQLEEAAALGQCQCVILRAR